MKGKGGATVSRRNRDGGASTAVSSGDDDGRRLPRQGMAGEGQAGAMVRASLQREYPHQGGPALTRMGVGDPPMRLPQLPVR